MAEALSKWCRTRVVPDEEAIRLLPGAAVVVGCDALSPEAVVNKAGTRALAEAAAARGVPRFVVAGDTKLVPEPVPVEEPFEATPLRLFTAVATPEGLLPPDEARARAREAPLHPGLRAMLPSRPRPSRSRRRPG
jgi:translation initiation factor 2B subunit (eIF-2B alpha/beta/delta family)